jgi:sugar lactone lactonase YvrE
VNDVELVLDAHAALGEGPIWLPADNMLAWVDITGHRVHRFDPATGRDESFDVGQPVGAVAPRASGGLAMALRDGFGLLDTATGRVEMIADTEADNPGNRMNDGKCDSEGRFWAGTMAFDSRPGAGALYRLDRDHVVTRMLSDVTVSNGIDWSLDNRTMYFVDSQSGLDAFDYEPTGGQITNRRRIVTIPADLGAPDGMTLDSEGYLWVAIWGGWMVRRYAPDGRIDREIRVPVARTSSCAFGGPDYADLYITTASPEPGSDEHASQPHSGGLFRVRPGVTGRPPNLYRG